MPRCRPSPALAGRSGRWRRKSSGLAAVRRVAEAGERIDRIANARPTMERHPNMITCYLRYIVDPAKLKEFEHYGKLWIPLVEKFGGQHHGYFLPSEGANNVALALFSFPSLALYETYRNQSFDDPECQAA